MKQVVSLKSHSMKVTVIQTKLYWEQPARNRTHFGELIEQVKEETDLVVLPEMFTTGFSMRPETIAEAADGPTLKWLGEIASKKNCAITGSVAVKKNEKYYNRLYWTDAAGKIVSYDKRHLFRMAKEEQHYTAGTQRIITEIKGWKICPLVCYDLRFPVWSRNRWHKNSGWEYDVLLYVANWPEVRSYHWKQLLIARAVENQCYVIGVNRIGPDGNGYAHAGDSVVIDPRGQVMSHFVPNEEKVETITLDRTLLDDYRKQFPVGMDADEFFLKPETP
jgi:predicted amidohydrolase